MFAKEFSKYLNFGQVDCALDVVDLKDLPAKELQMVKQGKENLCHQLHNITQYPAFIFYPEPDKLGDSFHPDFYEFFY